MMATKVRKTMHTITYRAKKQQRPQSMCFTQVFNTLVVKCKNFLALYCADVLMCAVHNVSTCVQCRQACSVRITTRYIEQDRLECREPNFGNDICFLDFRYSEQVLQSTQQAPQSSCPDRYAKNDAIPSGQN